MSYVKHVNVKAIAFAILICGILGYTLFQMQNVITGPVITIAAPQNGAEVDRALSIVEGTTRNITAISINGRNISVDEHGTFSEKLLLSPGYNIITLHAEDKFGRTTEKTLELIYTPSDTHNGDQENSEKRS